jgi:CRISPR-associated protein Cas1
MPHQPELPLTFPALTEDTPLIPVRMVNEYVYCPRLAYLEWVQGEFAHSADTLDGAIKHRRVDQPGGALPGSPEEGERIHARSVTLSSTRLGLTAKLDLVEREARDVVPVDYKRGRRPHIASGAYDPERVQLCAQGLLLRDHGFECSRGIIYYVASKERVTVEFDAALEEQTLRAAGALRGLALSAHIPPPLVDSPKCPRCSLVGICQPDEIGFLNETSPAPRPLAVAERAELPLVVQSPRAFVKKDGEVFVIEVEKEKVSQARINEVSHVALFGAAMLSTPALQECFRRQIPVSWHSYGGWFVGHTVGTGHRNVELRTAQYKGSFDARICLVLARGLVAAKIANCRTLLKRNWRGMGEGDDEDDDFDPTVPGTAGGPPEPPPRELLLSLKEDRQHAARAESIESLLGIEGAAAARYFRHFAGMLRSNVDPALAFDFTTRNRRPPKDPVNAMLSFAYAMLVRDWTIELSAVGLDAYRGFYHQPRFGRPALALDMMEPFRPLIAESVVLTAINNGELKPADFIRAAGSCNLTDSGRKRFIAVYERRLQQEVTHPLFGYRVSYRRLLEVQARLLGRFLTGEIREYPNFFTR